MKQSEFRGIINECVREVLAEGRKTKKSVAKEKAKKAIKEVLLENELEANDLDEAFFDAFKSKPVTDLKVGGTTTIVIDLSDIDLMIERGLVEKQIWDHKNTLESEEEELKSLTKSTTESEEKK